MLFTATIQMDILKQNKKATHIRIETLFIDSRDDLDSRKQYTFGSLTSKQSFNGIGKREVWRPF